MDQQKTKKCGWFAWGYRDEHVLKGKDGMPGEKMRELQLPAETTDDGGDDDGGGVGGGQGGIGGLDAMQLPKD